MLRIPMKLSLERIFGREFSKRLHRGKAPALQKMNEARTRLNESVKRLEIVEGMAQKLFEERCTGNVPDSVFRKLMQNYDVEQANLNQIIAEKCNVLMEIENAAIDISAWAFVGQLSA